MNHITDNNSISITKMGGWWVCEGLQTVYLTNDLGLFQPIIYSFSTLPHPEDSELFWPIKGLTCYHMTKVDQRACSNCNNSQNDLNNEQYNDSNKIVC